MSTHRATNDLSRKINPEFFNYLESAGFLYNKNKAPETGSFLRGTCWIYFRLDTVVIKPNTLRRFVFEGLENITLIGWAELLDLTGAVPLKELISQLSREDLIPVVDILNKKIGGLPVVETEQTPTLALQGKEVRYND